MVTTRTTPAGSSVAPLERSGGGAEADLGWSLGVLLRAYKDGVSAAVGACPHGHRGYQVLTTVVHGDQPSQLALAAYLGIDRTVMTYLIDDLVAAGLVERQLNPADRRQRKIVATGTGARTLADLERRVREAEDVTLAALEPPERDSFRALLRKVACDLRGVGGGDACAVVGEALAAADGAS
ncbi:winged helix-turn-helix transcriptional regulator [Georgenia yuyongxinii]|uniref:Winged helix-turn-helix transcriptional regulator n=1 Tax=Georgenia yuyongxinii TaxID=2589797 RepID=A0A5B8C0E4_9MICO|nr:MarR family winged helix-turn-helix transcriptional regulator [Georgenia yuyongxinii]QDC23490.1 winged helix-turn-helix transcriptional regulator [Georgenia yuyongxinii]